MMRARRRTGLVACLPVALLMLLGAPAANARAAAHVRFLQAQPGAPSAQLKVSSSGLTVSAGGTSAFGETTPYANVAPGQARLLLSTGQSSSITLADGARYTVVALRQAGRTQLRVLRDGSAKAGTGRLRILNLAPELGAPDARLGGRVIAQGVRYAQDPGYIDITPGSYLLALAGTHSSKPLVSRNLALSAGSAATAIVTGTAGSPVRLSIVTDDTLTPGGPPQTGLGGLARGGEVSWLLVALAAFAGAALAAGLSVAYRGRAGGP